MLFDVRSFDNYFMATINRFEDLEIWQLAFNQTKDFDLLVETTPLAKGSNGEFRSQLYRCLNRKHILQQNFDELYLKNAMLGRKIMTFIQYLQKTEYKGQRYKKEESPNQPQTLNLKPQTK